MEREVKPAVFLFALVLAVGLVVGCGSKGSQFLGKWTKISGPSPSQMEITKNGDGFLIKVGSESPIGASLKDGMLMVGDLAPITYIEKTDHITLANFAGTTEYERAK